jgi:hypothetical protein
MTATLGRLIPVPVREVWAHEAKDFTPWLAKGENLALLAETLGLDELQIQSTEVPVGDFYIDILARDREGNVVIIENQFGPTDHKHLGQIMTYIGDKESNVTVVWIAERFREEHRGAIDWLNESTIEGFNFFAVEIQAMKIGSSLPAPRFNVVAKPNEYSRSVTRTTRQAGDTDRQKFYTAYWSQFAAFLADKHLNFKVRAIPKDYWCNFRIGRAGVHFAATARNRDKKIGVELYIARLDDKATFRALEAQKADIEHSFGDKLEWQELPNKTASRIAIFKSADPANEPDRRNQFEWLASMLERFHFAFYDRIRALNIEGASEDEGADREREE